MDSQIWAPGAATPGLPGILESTVEHDFSAPPARLQLRPYQRGLVEDFRAAVAEGKRRLLLTLPTGAGKTVIIVEVAAGFAEAGKKVVIIVHRRELLEQISRKLHVAGLDHGIIAAGYPARPGEKIQLVSVATMCRRPEIPDANCVIIDEAHRSVAASYRKIVDACPSATVLGVTATPCRGDGRGLGEIFESLIVGPSVEELTAAGWLVPATVYAPVSPDLTGIKIERGDYNETQLAKRMNEPRLVGDATSNWLRLAKGRPTVLFAAGVAHSLAARDDFRRAGVMAEHIDGTTPTEERDAILRDLAAGKIEIICNALVLTEGWDCPVISCALLFRPTKSFGQYRQMIGRVLRPFPGKTDALILDHAGAVFEHGLPSDPVDWTLSADSRAVNPRQAARIAAKAPGLVTCPECDAVRFSGRPCTVCGWRPKPRAVAVDVIDGDLGRVERSKKITAAAYSEGDKRSFYSALAWIGIERGYQAGWAIHKFKEKFGHWPKDRFASPISPSDEVRAWVRSRQIAYAKAQQKAKSA